MKMVLLIRNKIGAICTQSFTLKLMFRVVKFNNDFFYNLYRHYHIFVRLKMKNIFIFYTLGVFLVRIIIQVRQTRKSVENPRGTTLA